MPKHELEFSVLMSGFAFCVLSSLDNVIFQRIQEYVLLFLGTLITMLLTEMKAHINCIEILFSILVSNKINST